MELSPKLYNWFVRPKWFSHLLINGVITKQFDFTNKQVLDFGCGIGSCCSIFSPDYYMGVDCDAKRIYYASHNNPQHSFKVMNGHNLPALRNSFDYILIISVLHHIAQKELTGYLKEFHRILKPNGKIIVYEPCFFENNNFNNLFMKVFDRGKYIQIEDKYLEMFTNCNYDTEIHERYHQLLFYNKLFFSASPII
jgi:ubiquinone/menaquinone biosynthesis C-methylase UbiE